MKSKKGSKYFLSMFFWIYVLIISIPCKQYAQVNQDFNIQLLLDYNSAEQCIALYEDQFVNTQIIASTRGNRIAASTTGLISNNQNVESSLINFLDSLKYHQSIQNDIYHLEDARKSVNEIKELLTELKTRNFNQKVVATVEQIFPQDAKLSLTIPVYVVALGHENVDAYVRRIIWFGDRPQFVGEGQGELTIIINLAHSVKYGTDVQERFISLLGVVAHEVFHAAFSEYKKNSLPWKKFYEEHQTHFDVLLDLTHNEGIAYYLSLEQQGGGKIPRDFFKNTLEAFNTFNVNASELLSKSITNKRARELIQNANLSGYSQNYGAMTGMFMAREIDKRLGRSALIESISLNPYAFFKKYLKIAENDNNLPNFTNLIKNKILSEE
jgi:hypothetical protein